LGGSWLSSEKNIGFVVAWFCNEEKFEALSLRWVGIHQRSLKGQFFLLAGGGKLSWCLVGNYIGSNAAGNPIVGQCSPNS